MGDMIWLAGLGTALVGALLFGGMPLLLVVASVATGVFWVLGG